MVMSGDGTSTFATNSNVQLLGGGDVQLSEQRELSIQSGAEFLISGGDFTSTQTSVVNIVDGTLQVNSGNVAFAEESTLTITKTGGQVIIPGGSVSAIDSSVLKIYEGVLKIVASSGNNGDLTLKDSSSMEVKTGGQVLLCRARLRRY